MKYNYLRMMLLSMLVMLCGTSFAEDKTETIDLAGAFADVTVTSAGTNSTGGSMSISQGDVLVTSELGYVKEKEMSIYKNGSLTIALSENVTGYITKVELTLSNSYNFNVPDESTGWSAVYSTEGTSAKVAKGSTETFTTTATDLTSLTLQNSANGKTGIQKIVVEYTTVAGENLQTPNISFSETEFTVAEGDSFTPPTLTYDGDGAITYSSSAPNVASVDETTGAVELLSAGTATIIATAAKTDTYKSVSASYTITVTLSNAPLSLPWTEDWSKYAVNEVPSKKNINYTEDNGGGTTKIYNEKTAGGTAPELLVAKNNGSFTASNISLASLENKAAKLILTYHTNQKAMSVTTTVEGVEIGDATADDTDTKLYTREITVPANTATLDLTFIMTTSSNGRLDDISLTLGEIEEEPVGFRDIKADLTQLQDLATESNVYITVAEDGTISQTDNADKAAATLKGKWHGPAYGWSNFTASVPVEGTVKITYATHDYGNDITVTDDSGEQVAKLNTKGDKWSSNHDNVVSTYYRVNEPTTLHFSNANYNPYFAVEAIDPADLPAEVTVYNVTFGAGDAQGVAPAAVEVEDGNSVKLPKNYTLYKEGSTLTGWNDGTETHAPGAEITPTSDLTLTPVFTENTVSLDDREAAVVISYDLSGYNDAPKHNFQSGDGIIVTQASVNGSSIDVAVTTNGKFAHNGNGWHQLNQGTKVTVPSCKGATVTVKTYQNANALKFGETAAEAEADPATFTATEDDATLVIEQTAQGYWNKLSITLPAKESEEEQHDPVTLIWDYTEKNIPTKGPDDGLYYNGYVNDAAGTNNGMHGVKLNSSGYAFFEKPAVAGKLTLTIGNRKSTSAFAVNVYSCTVADGVATKGDLIGEVEVAESPGTGSIDIEADVTGIYIERKTTVEGVLQKIVFKETVARKFVDFEITNDEMKTAGYDGSTLPAGVTFSGTHRGDAHGYGNVTIVVPVDGTVKFQLGGCRYANPANCKVTNSAGEVVATPTLKTDKCYHEDGTVTTYFYTGEPTTLTFSDIAYLSYFKAEATEVSEVTVTYKDQNGNTLGTKKVFEGEQIGEVPYTEADLTIEEGYKFRGWVYTSGIKVKAEDTVSGDVSVNASVTEIEVAPETGTIQTYDLTKATFYPEDHENFDVENGSYYNNHGFTFAAGGTFQVAVSSKAQVVLALCQFGSGTTITVTDPSGNVVADDVPAKAETDGATTSIDYEGEAGMLTFTFAEQTYLHKVTVYNVSDFLEKDEASGYYIVPAGDAASLVLALNNAASEPNSKIFLPNGTYDFGEAVLTGISGTNVSIVGQDVDKTIIVTAPPVSMEGLEKADLFLNTSTGLYLQDITLKNALDYYAAGSSGRAAVLHDKGTKTICKNVKMLSYQDTYYSHKVGGLYYFEGGEVHGTVDYMCGNGKAYFNEVKIVNEERSSATMTANSELYVYNNCTVENHANTYNFGRAWSDHPVCVWLNTTLEDPANLATSRWNLTGINCDYSIAGEYGTKNVDGDVITPSENTVTFTKENTTLNTILTAEQAATYTIDYVLGDWAATAKEQAVQVEAPDATITNGVISWSAVDGATSYALFKNDELLGITNETTYDTNAESSVNGAPRKAEGEDVLTIRAANLRGGFGEAKVITLVSGIDNVGADKGNVVSTTYYNIAGARVSDTANGVLLKVEKLENGKTVTTKVIR